MVLVSLIFEGNPTDENLQLADLNGDGNVNILDVVILADIILN